MKAAEELVKSTVISGRMYGMSTLTITEFLEARIDDDEARASSGWARLGDSRWETDNYGRDFLTPSAVLAECAAKRAIVEDHEVYENYCAGCDGPSPCYTLCILAAVYKDHPDYRQEWAL